MPHILPLNGFYCGSEILKLLYRNTVFTKYVKRKENTLTMHYYVQFINYKLIRRSCTAMFDYYFFNGGGGRVWELLGGFFLGGGGCVKFVFCVFLGLLFK